MVETLLLPTEEACAAYGIPRRGTNGRFSSDPSPQFLNGPQFSKINSVPPPLSSDTSTGNGSYIDEIILEFIKNQPYTLDFKKQESVSGAPFMKAEFKTGEDSEPILKIQIAPNTTDWVNFTTKHNWETPGGLIKFLFDQVAPVASDLNDLFTDVKNVSSTGGTQAKQTIQVDQADAYKSTEKIEFSVPFLLWSSGSTVENWIRDIYSPIMLLTALSHPKRSVDANIGEAYNKIVGNLSEDTQKVIKDSGFGTAGDGIATINKLTPGTRIVILDPPSYVKVRHSSGLFTFKRCVITSFSFKYLDPWVRATSSNSLDASKQFLSRSLPMRAECVLNMKSIEPMYADDWLTMFQEGADVLGSSGRISIKTK